MTITHPTTRRAAVALSLACAALSAFASPSASPSTSTPAPWWAAFAEPGLDALMQTSAPASSPAEQQLVQGYIAARTGQLRVQLAQTLALAAREEQALLMSVPPAPDRDQALAAAGRRLEAVENGAAALQAARDAQIAALASESGVAPERLLPWVAPEGAATLPRVGAPLPAAALRARVPEPLAVLAEQARQVDAGTAWVATRRSDWQARLQRQRLGGGDALGTLQAYQQYIVDTDQLAVASAQLALTWAQWLQYSSGGTPLAAAR